MFCGQELSGRFRPAEPFTGYPPPFSDTATIEPPATAEAPPEKLPAAEHVEVPEPAPQSIEAAPEPEQPADEVRPAEPPSFVFPSVSRPEDAGAFGASTADAPLAGLDLPQEVFAAIYGLTKANMRIPAISMLRQHSDLSLTDATDRIDRLGILLGVRQKQCYIATACYGDADHPDVESLRRFRDEVLLRTVWGRAFVRVYYVLSPRIAERLGRHALPAAILRRAVLEPLVRGLHTRSATRR
jgi:hypothetical protein